MSRSKLCLQCYNYDECDQETMRETNWGDDCDNPNRCFSWENAGSGDDDDCNCCIGGFSK